MYNALLTKVHRVIDDTVGRKPSSQEEWNHFYNSMFNPDAHNAYMEEQRKKESLRTKLVVGTTVLAAVGEGYHLAKRSGILDKIRK